MPKVSVIMGVHNGEKTLSRAIDSILNQTFSDFELIICDDFSTDATYKIMKSYALKDNRIIILKNERNLGLAASLNKCINISKGEYIARMDDDDISYSERFCRQVDFLDHNHKYAFVSSIVDCYDGKEIVRNHFLRKAEPQKRDFL